MTTIKATCWSCGQVALTHKDIVLRVDEHDIESNYSFDCPGCREHVTKPADSRVVALLESGGVIPVPLRPAARFPDQPAFTYDDLLDFHIELEGLEDGTDR